MPPTRQTVISSAGRCAMGQGKRLAALLLLGAGCVNPAGERVRDLNADGVYLYDRGSYAQARDSFAAALTMRPGDPDMLYNMGRSCQRLRQTERAEDAYRQCLRQNPTHDACRHALVELLVDTGRRDEAVVLVREWLVKEPSRASPYIEDAWLLRREGDLLNARGRLQQALALEPMHPRALVDLGKVYEALARPERAVVLYERALEVDPHQPEIARQVSLLRSRGTGRPQPD